MLIPENTHKENRLDSGADPDARCKNETRDAINPSIPRNATIRITQSTGHGGKGGEEKWIHEGSVSSPFGPLIKRPRDSDTRA